MALASVAASSNPRRSKDVAIRSFPPLCAPGTTEASQPAVAGNLISNQKASPTPLITPPPEPTSCGPGSDFLSYRGKIFKRPIAFAIRKFPKGCGSLAAPFPKSSKEASIDIVRRIPEERSDEKDVEKPNRKSSLVPDFVEGGRRFCRPEGYEAKNKVEETEEELNNVVRRIPKEESGLGKILEKAVVGKSVGGKDGEKPNRKSSLMPDFVKDGKRFCRPEGSVAKNKIEEMEGELNDVVRRTSKEGSGLGKILKNAVVGKSLGRKDGEKPNSRSSLMPHFVKDGKRFSRPVRPESKSKVEDMEVELNDVVRRISKEGSGFRKILENDVVGRSLGEKDGKKPNRKRSLMPDLVENGSSKGGQLLEVRGDRLIVQCLMAAKRCPWMQGKGKGSIGLQYKQKKPKIMASGNSNKG